MKKILHNIEIINIRKKQVDKNKIIKRIKELIDFEKKLFLMKHISIKTRIKYCQKINKLILKLKKTYKLKYSKQIKYSFCKNCKNLFNSKNSITRIYNSYIVKICLNCKKRYVIKKIK